MALGTYKADQGYWTRTITGIAVLALTMAGALWAWNQVDRFNFDASTAQIIKWSAAGLIVAIGIAAGLMFVYFKPSTAEFLIATEGEMKKVNWSTRREVLGSTWVVITVSLSIAAILWLVDLGFSSFFRAIKLLGPGM
ncbi:MAG: preprotein translocase subunit SecE [Planctomycetes bacterium]|nr:preprotein translocase subunit SecE [Planctomycetota bacterium]